MSKLVLSNGQVLEILENYDSLEYNPQQKLPLNWRLVSVVIPYKPDSYNFIFINLDHVISVEL